MIIFVHSSKEYQQQYDDVTDEQIETRLEHRIEHAAFNLADSERLSRDVYFIQRLRAQGDTDSITDGIVDAEESEQSEQKPGLAEVAHGLYVDQVIWFGMLVSTRLLAQETFGFDHQLPDWFESAKTTLEEHITDHPENENLRNTIYFDRHPLSPIAMGRLVFSGIHMTGPYELTHRQLAAALALEKETAIMGGVSKPLR